MKVSIKPTTFGQNIYARINENTTLGVAIRVSPYRKLAYFRNGKPVQPFGAKSPTAKLIPYFKEMLTYATI